MINFKESEKVNISPISNSLLNVFTDNYYLELGNIDYTVIDKILKRELVCVDEVAYFDIQNIGIGHASKSTKSLKDILPYIYFENIQNKERSIQLFITCGLLSKVVANKAETFAPIVLIQVKLIFLNGKYYFQSNGIPTENTILFNGLAKSELSMVNEKAVNSFTTIYDIDEFCMQFTRLNNYVVKLENFLTFAFTQLPAIVMDHDRYTLSSNFPSYLGNKYYIPGKDEICNITLLNDKQRLAVQRCNLGDNFVISGVIGTGKTTALMNIATNEIKQGKKVLYVSSNIETIERVESKFNELEIGNLVANLTDPLIGRSFFQKPKVKNINIKDNNKQLVKAYAVIDAYEKNITGRVLNFRFVDVIKELLKISAPSEDVEIDDLHDIYKYEAFEIIEALQKIEKAKKAMPRPKDSLFSNIPVNNDIEYSDVPIKIVDDLYNSYKGLFELKNELENKYGLTTIPNYAKFKNVVSDIKKVNIEHVPTGWITTKQEKYFEAKDTFSDFKTRVGQVKETKAIIDWEFKDIEEIDVNELISNLLGEYFKENEIDKVNSVISNIHNLLKVSNNSVKIIEDLKQFLTTFNKKYEYNGKFDSNWLNEVVSFSQFLSESYVYNKWCNLNRCNYFNSEIKKYETILTNYEIAKEEYYSVFKNYKDYQVGLEKLNKAIETKRPYRQFSLDEIKKIAEDVKNNLVNVNNIEKAYSEYESLVGVAFSLGFNASAKFANFYDYITSLSNENLKRSITRILVLPSKDDVKRIANRFLDQTNKIKALMENFNMFLTFINLPDKYLQKSIGYDLAISLMPEINEYFDKVNKANNLMKKTVKDTTDVVRFDTYLRLRESLDNYNIAEEKLDQSNDYVNLYGDLYKKGQTTLNDVAMMLTSFASYMDYFTSKEALVKSLDLDNNKEINRLLDKANSIILEINDSFNAYNKIFKDGIGEYYYDELDKVIEHWKKLLDSKAELDTYLEFTNQIRILFKHKLFKFATLIINGEVGDITNLFKYRYYKMVYDTYKNSIENYISTKNVSNALRQVVNYEKIYIANNINELKKMCSDVNVKFEDLNYDHYIEASTGIKYLYLCDVKTLNRYIDIDKFDLVLVDDANLGDADDYDKAVSAKRIIFAGEESYRMSTTASLLTRFRSESIMTFDYRYVPTPIAISNRIKSIHSMITPYEEKEAGLEVLNVDGPKYILELIKDNPNVIINYYTSLPSVQRKMFDSLASLLVKENFSREKIIDILRHQINICDLGLGYFYEADYNIINYDEYGKQFSQDFSAWATNVLLCRKKIIILSNKSDLDVLQDLKRTNEQFYARHINPTPTRINGVGSSAIEKLATALKRNKFDVIGSYGDLCMIVENKGEYFVVLLFVNPDSSNFNIISDYRELYQANMDKGIKTFVVWLEDLYEDFESVKKDLITKLNSAKDHK